MKKKILYLLILILFFAACKYEDGPAISLRSKTNRLLKEWKIEKMIVDGSDSTQQYIDSCGCNIEFYWDQIISNVENKVYLRNCKYNPNSGATPSHYCCPNGYFEFQDHKKILRVNSIHSAYKGFGPIGNGDSYWNIIKLTSKSFWFKTNFNNKIYEFKLKAI